MDHHFKSLKSWKHRVIVPRVLALLTSSLFVLVVMAAIIFQTIQNTSQRATVNTQAAAVCSDQAGSCDDNAACDGKQGQWCNQGFLRCEENKPISRNLQCVPDGNDGNRLKWKYLGDGPTTCNFYSDSCGGTAPPSPGNGGVACTGRPFALIFKLKEGVVPPGRTVHCRVQSTSNGCVPCGNLKLTSGCDIQPGQSTCSTAENDCVCNPHKYTCDYEGVVESASSGTPRTLASGVVLAANTLDEGDASCANDSSCEKPVNPPPPAENPPPANNPQPTTPPSNNPADKCEENKTTCGSKCGSGGAGKCDECNGGWCNGGVCSTCAEKPPNNPPPSCQEGKTPCTSCADGTTCSACNGGMCSNKVCTSCAPPPASPTPVQPTEIVDKPAAKTISKKANNPELAQTFVCLKAEGCSGTSCPGLTQADHGVKLSTKDDVKPSASDDSWIFECINTNSGRRCTSGNSQTDVDTLGEDNVSFLKGDVGYAFGLFLPINGSRNQNPIKIGSSKDVGFWESFTSKQVGRVFLAMNQTTPGSSNGGLGGQHQAGLLFDSPDKKCIQIFWDPYGTVFDVDTLAPVADAKITIYKKINGTYELVTRKDVMSAIQNPYFTAEDGKYRFLLPDGTYKMKIEANGYTWIKTVNNPGQYQNMYNGDDIIQVGGPKRYDIGVRKDPSLIDKIIKKISGK